MKGLINKTGLNRKELTVILFLLFTFAAGIIIKLSGWKQPVSFDYSKSDAKFEQQLMSSFSELGQKDLDSSQQQRLAELRQYTDSLFILNERESKKPIEKLTANKININLALSGDLLQLPGIGTVTAERIIEFREKYGRFYKTEDLMKVKGIGEKKFEKIKDYLTVD